MRHLTICLLLACFSTACAQEQSNVHDSGAAPTDTLDVTSDRVGVTDHRHGGDDLADRQTDVFGGYLAFCTDGTTCGSGLCVPWDHPWSGGFCSKTCEMHEDCGEGLACPPPIGFGEDFDCAGRGAACVCQSSTVFLCKPCDDDEGCTSPVSPETVGYCLLGRMGGGGRCASSCDDTGACPTGYSCKPLNVGSMDIALCVPVAGACMDP